MRVGWETEPISGSRTTARGERDTSRGHSGWRSRGGSPGPELIARAGPDSPKSRLKRNLADRGTSHGLRVPTPAEQRPNDREMTETRTTTHASRRLSPPPEQRRTPLHRVKRPLKIRRLYCTVRFIRRTHHLDREALGYMLP